MRTAEGINDILTALNITINEDLLSLSNPDDDNDRNIGWYATSDIKLDTTLLTVPSGSFFFGSLNEKDDVPTLLDDLASETDTFTRLVLRVLHHSSDGVESKFADYLNLFPVDYFADIAVNWKEETLDLLSGSTLYVAEP